MLCLREAKTPPQHRAPAPLFWVLLKKELLKPEGMMCIPAESQQKPHSTRPQATAKGKEKCCQAAPGPHCSPQVVHAIISAS